MEVKAKLRHLRMSPKKVRLVADLVRGMSVQEAVSQLEYSKKLASRPVLKLLNSAISNAENNNKLTKNSLFIKKISVNGGPIMYRWRPRAYGRSAPIRKRSSHIEIILDSIGSVSTKKVEKSIAQQTIVDNLPKSAKIENTNKLNRDKTEDKQKSNSSKEERHDKEIFDKSRKGKKRENLQQDKQSKTPSQDELEKKVSE